MVDEDLVPNLLIAGVTKAGTSSLFWYLIQHPRICPPRDRKEIDYFTPLRYGHGPSGPLAEYKAHFKHCGEATYRLDASPHYFDGGPHLVATVQQTLPDARVLIMLRDPVARFWSAYRTRMATGILERRTTLQDYFDACLAARTTGRDKDERDKKYRELSQGCYVEPLSHWFDAFGRNVRVVFFEHLAREPVGVVSDVCDWLGVGTDHVLDVDLAVRNKTVDPRSVRVSNLAHTVNHHLDPLLRRAPVLKESARQLYAKVNGRRNQRRLSEDERRMLQEFYEPANSALHLELARRGYRDFPAWLIPKTEGSRS